MAVGMAPWVETDFLSTICTDERRFVSLTTGAT